MVGAVVAVGANPLARVGETSAKRTMSVEVILRLREELLATQQQVSRLLQVLRDRGLAAACRSGTSEVDRDEQTS